MLLQLYKLYQKNGAAKIPLEDFTTEAFAGLLRLNPILLDQYTKLIQLPEDNYKVETQKYYLLADTMNCIIDMVLIGKKNICFIENKVHSTEGVEQLIRYGRVLSENYPQHGTYLRYCTKYPDPKETLEHSFMQIMWSDIAKLLPKKGQDSLTDFHHFLKYHNMANNNTIDVNAIASMKNLRDTINMATFYISNSLPSFKAIFLNAELASELKANNIVEKDRFGHLYKYIINDSARWSELLYSINFRDVEISTQIYVDYAHEKHDIIIKRLKEFKDFKSKDYDSGTSIVLSKKITDFFEDENSDMKIKDWFYNSFIEFAKLIKATPELNWKIKVNEALLLEKPLEDNLLPTV